MTESTGAEIEALKSDIAVLREEVSALRAQIAAAQGRIKLTMRGQARCPACGECEILHSARVSPYLSEEMGLCLLRPHKAWGKIPQHGEFEVYVCMSCGMAEWYVRSFEGIDASHERFTVISTTSPAPYR